MLNLGETTYSAIKKCPLIKIYNPDYEMYKTKSDAFFKLLSKYSYCVQKASIDEGYIEVTGIIKGNTMEELKKKSIIYAKTLQNDVKNTLGFTINIGISNSKIIAKTASDLVKPNKIIPIFHDELKEKLYPLDISKLFLVGKKTEEKLKKHNITKIGNLTETDDKLLEKLLRNTTVQN